MRAQVWSKANGDDSRESTVSEPPVDGKVVAGARAAMSRANLALFLVSNPIRRRYAVASSAQADSRR